MKFVFLYFQFDFLCNIRYAAEIKSGGFAYILLQRISGKWCLVDVGSRVLLPAEKRFSVTELKCLGVVWAIRHAHQYVCGRHFKIITDHIALFPLLSKKEFASLPSSRM